MSIFLSYGLLGAIAGPVVLLFSHRFARGEALSWELVGRIGPPPLLAAGGLLGVALIYVVQMVPAVMAPVSAWLVILGFLLALIDWSCHRLPHSLVGVLLTGGLVQFGVIALVQRDAAPLVRAGAASVVVFAVGLVIYLRLRATLGFGDVTLAAASAAYLGWFDWRHVLFGLVAGLALAAVTTLALLAFRRIQRGDQVALGPALIAGSICTILHM